MGFSGCFTALITPFSADGSVDIKSYRKLVRRQVDSGVDGVVVLGTTGESLSLTREEAKALILVAVEEAKKRALVIVGTGTSDTKAAISRTQTAKELGADAALVVLPYYNQPPLRGIYAHFEKITGVGLPVIAYHHPKRTGVQLSVEELCQIPCISAIKESSGSLEYAKRLIAKATVPILCGDDILTSQMIDLGARGAISVISNALPAEWKRVVNQGGAGAYLEILSALSLEPNPIPIKCLLHLMDLSSPQMRLPLVEALPSTRLALERAFSPLAQDHAAV